MNIEKVYHEELEYKFLLKINKETLESKVVSFLQAKAKTYKKPGFRPGKVPLSVLEKEMGQEARSDFIYHEIRNAYSKALADNKIVPIREPQVKQIEDQSDDFLYEIIVEETPTFELQDFSEIKLKKVQATLPEEQIDGFVKKLQKIHGTYKGADRPSEEGDFISVKFTVKHDGKVLGSLDGQEDILELDLKSSNGEDFIKNFINVKIGDSITVSRKGEDYSEELKDKTVEVFYVVEKIETCTPSPLDESFYKKLDTSNMEDLRLKLTEILSQSTNRMTHMYLKRQLLDALNEKYTFSIPPNMVAEEKKVIVRKIEEEEQKSGDLDEKITDQELDDLAKRRVRLGILIGKIASENKLSVSKDMLMGAMYQAAERSSAEPEKMIRTWAKDHNIISFFRSQLLEILTLDFLLEKSTIEVKEVTAQELYKEVSEVIPDEVYDVDFQG